jgi:hypothetical protein
MWRPIETAPRDGSVILVWDTAPYWYGADRSVGPAVAAWHKNERVWAVVGDGGVLFSDYGACDCSPTHWMPLPEPPIDGAGRKIEAAGKVAENEGENG